ncbi:4950_t:CDS:2, partial [Gigaspora margarita]
IMKKFVIATMLVVAIIILMLQNVKSIDNVSCNIVSGNSNCSYLTCYAPNYKIYYCYGVDALHNRGCRCDSCDDRAKPKKVADCN